MNGIQNLMSASVFSLAIALTVFVVITVILLVLLIALSASKNFRTVFFREKQKKSKKRKTDKAALSEPREVSEPKATEPKSTRSSAAHRRGGAEPEYLSAIPTVPLGGIPQAQPTPTGRRSNARMRTEFEAIEEQPRATYTTRSVTITRARSNSIKTANDETDNSEPKGRSAKKR